MGDRIVIAFFVNGDYKVSLYDHWGGYIMRDIKELARLEAMIREIASLSNGFGNFLTMFIQAYREYRGYKPKKAYTIYLELIPAEPDHKVIAYDYTEGVMKLMEVNEFYKIAEKKYPNIALW